MAAGVDLQTYLSVVGRELATHQQRVGQLTKFKEEYEELQEMVRTLPEKTHHDIMVPIGSLAFMPGRLVHTNEFLVLYGDNYFVERSATQTVDIIGRRLDFCNEQIEAETVHVRNLESRLHLAGSMIGTEVTPETVKAGGGEASPYGVHELEGGVMEIRETLEENDIDLPTTSTSTAAAAAPPPAKKAATKKAPVAAKNPAAAAASPTSAPVSSPAKGKGKEEAGPARPSEAAAAAMDARLAELERLEALAEEAEERGEDPSPYLAQAGILAAKQDKKSETKRSNKRNDEEEDDEGDDDEREARDTAANVAAALQAARKVARPELTANKASAEKKPAKARQGTHYAGDGDGEDEPLEDEIDDDNVEPSDDDDDDDVEDDIAEALWEAQRDPQDVQREHDELAAYLAAMRVGDAAGAISNLGGGVAAGAGAMMGPAPPARDVVGMDSGAGVGRAAGGSGGARGGVTFAEADHVREIRKDEVVARSGAGGAPSAAPRSPGDIFAKITETKSAAPASAPGGSSSTPKKGILKIAPKIPGAAAKPAATSAAAGATTKAKAAPAATPTKQPGRIEIGEVVERGTTAQDGERLALQMEYEHRRQQRMLEEEERGAAVNRPAALMTATTAESIRPVSAAPAAKKKVSMFKKQMMQEKDDE